MDILGKIEDRRKFPRIKLAKMKPEIKVKLVFKRLFFKYKKIECKLREISGRGALLIVDNYKRKHILEKYIDKPVLILSTATNISFNFKKKGKVLRIIEKENEISVVVIFNDNL